MSKWLRRGNNNNTNTEFPSPPRNDMNNMEAPFPVPMDVDKKYYKATDSRSSRSSRDRRSRPQQPSYRNYYKTNNLGTSTPPDQVQPSFPPPAVTADSPPPVEAQQRRPAYLLHRDLVIGKGSYGQVCIASRGEQEGRSKRKKFACKCVMLRNDPKYIAKLQEEVNVLRELRGHDNVIRLFDVFCVDNELFIITELGRGGDLFHLLTTHPKHGVTESYAGTCCWFLFIYSCVYNQSVSYTLFSY